MPYLAAVLLLAGSAPGWAAEARCAEIEAQGGKCICSEPLNTTSYTTTLTAAHQNPGDSTTKECNLEKAGVGTAFVKSAGSWSASNDPSILAALPSGHTVSRVVKMADGATGGFPLGHWWDGAEDRARRAFRWYIYISPAATPTTGSLPGDCLNAGKMLSYHDQGPTLTYDGGDWAIYAFTEWTPQSPCCSGGPGEDAGAQAALTWSNLVGKWHRLEAVAENIGGVPTVLKIYWKNITDNGPNWKLIDTSIPGGEWTVTEATTLTRAWWDTGDINWFRNGTCAGFYAGSHILYASWPTNAGQLIGAASEIEGGAGPTTPAVPILESVTTP